MICERSDHLGGSPQRSKIEPLKGGVRLRLIIFVSTFIVVLGLFPGPGFVTPPLAPPLQEKYNTIAGQARDDERFAVSRGSGVGIARRGTLVAFVSCFGVDSSSASCSVIRHAVVLEKDSVFVSTADLLVGISVCRPSPFECD